MVLFRRSSALGVFSHCKESAYDDLFLTISNVFMAYSDFPVKEDYMKYSRKEEYAAYLDRYVDHFQLRKHIKFETKVTSARLATGARPVSKSPS